MAENGAVVGKLEIAKRAKELGYDAIHDTVHEMAKDEARHGCGFKGLYDRYFQVISGENLRLYGFLSSVQALFNLLIFQPELLRSYPF